MLDCLASTELKFQGELLTKHDATEQHERPQKEPPTGPPVSDSARSPRAAGLCRALQGPSPQIFVPIGSTRLQLPSKSALFYIEGGFYTSGPVGLSTMPRTQPNRARSRILCPSGALATPPEP